MKRIILILSILTLATAPAQSQGQRYKKHLHNLDIGAGVGFHSVQFKPEEGGDKNGRVGMTFNANYRMALFEKVNLTAGLGLTTYSAKSSYDDLNSEVQYKDPDNGETYTFSAHFTDWTELQKSINLEVPVGACYIFPLRHNIWKLVAGGGLKLDIPVSKKYKTQNNKSDGNMERTGKFKSTNVEYSDLQVHGFYDSDKFTGKAKMKGAGLSAFAEVGMTRPLNGSKTIYFGAYFSHSVLNSLKKSDNPLLDPESDSYSGVVSSELVDKTHLIAVGAKVAISFGL